MVLAVVEADMEVDEMKSTVEELKLRDDQDLIVVVNKIDTIGDCNGFDKEEALATITGWKAVAVSASEGKEMDKLIKAIKEVGSKYSGQDGMIVTNARHLAMLRESEKALSRAEEGLNSELTGDLIAQDIRVAMNAMAEITGEVSTEELLGNIFSRFCIGK